jgi:bifunctional non-homologous end joining protein LigD
MKVGTQTIEIKNRDKIFFPSGNLTKSDVIDYYADIAEHLLPYLKDRPLTLSRFPDGIKAEGFYQKKTPDYFPDWITVMEVQKKEGGTISQIICNDKATLIFLVNEGTLSFHPWLSEVSDLEKPNKMVFDLDPPKRNFDLVLKGARALRTLLEDELDLTAFVMTTGSKGLHVVVPIETNFSFDIVRTYAEVISAYLTREYPDSFTTEVRKKKREGRLFIDYLRNAYAQTSIPPYSLRALEGAPVATPLSWEELDKKGLTSQTYHIGNIFRRLSQTLLRIFR